MGRSSKAKRNPEHHQEMERRFERREMEHRQVLECRREMTDPLAVVSFRPLTEAEVEARAKAKRVEAREAELERIVRELKNARAEGDQ